MCEPKNVSRGMVFPALLAILSSPMVWAGVNLSSLGPEGGTIYLVAASPKIPGTVYAAAWRAGLFRSTDGGASWTAANAGLPSDRLGSYVSALAIDPKSPSTVYAAATAGESSVGGVFKSTDGGISWRAADSGLPGCVTGNLCPPNEYLLPVNSLTIDPQNSDTLYAAIGCRPCYGTGVFKTTDGGATWRAAGSGLPLYCCVSVLAIDPQNPNTLYAAASDAIFKSTDGGASWGSANSGLPNDPARGHLEVASLAIDPRNSATLFAGTRLGLFKTEDGGTIWRKSDSGLVSHFPDFYESRVSSLAIAAQDSNTIYAVFGDGVFKSTDAGVSWNVIHSGLPESSGGGQILAGLLYTLSIDPVSPNTLYVGSEAGGGVLKSTDGGASWKAVNSGLRASSVNALAVDPHDPRTLYSLIYGRGLFKTTDGGASWSPANSGLPGNGNKVGAPAIDPLNSATLYVVAFDAAYKWAVYKSTDGGLNWSEVDSQPNLSSVAVLAVDPQSPSTVYAGGWGGVFKSTDGGASWQDTGAPASVVTKLVFDPKDSGIVYAGTSSLAATPDSPGQRDSRVLKSVDGGRTWTAPPNFPSQGGTFPDGVTDLATDPQTPGTVYAATSDWDGIAVALWKTTDGGTTWHNVWPYPFSYLSAVVVSAQNAGTIYVASDQGLRQSTDGGASWNVIDFRPRVYALALDLQSPSTLYAGTAGRGVFAIALVP